MLTLHKCKPLNPGAYWVVGGGVLCIRTQFINEFNMLPINIIEVSILKIIEKYTTTFTVLL